MADFALSIPEEKVRESHSGDRVSICRAEV